MGWQALGSPTNFPASAGDTGVYAQGADRGAVGYSPLGIGLNGQSDSGIGAFGICDNGTGVLGNSVYGDAVRGVTRGAGNAVYGRSDGGGFAGYFVGFVTVTQDLSANNLALGGNVNKSGTCNFKIDHPVDPANRYLYHCAVESPDMKNIYDGAVTVDSEGEAVVELPEWFEALNQDFRYQLTPVGAPGPNLYVAEKIRGGRFKIAGGQPGMEVSWQVTGVRHDAYAIAHRIQVEEEKSEAERGCYLHPELFGQPPEKSIDWARQDRLRRIRERRAATHPDLPRPGLRDEGPAAAHGVPPL